MVVNEANKVAMADKADEDGGRVSLVAFSRSSARRGWYDVLVDLVEQT